MSKNQVYYDDSSKHNLTGGKWVYVDKNGVPLNREQLKDYDLSNPIYYSDPTSNPRAGNEFKGDDIQNERALAAHVQNVRKGQQNLQRIKDQTLNVAGFVPFLGDALDLGSAANDISKGKYLAAGTTLGLMFLPDILVKPIQKGIKSGIELSSDLYHSIGHNPIQRFQLQRQGRLLENKGLISREQRRSISKIRIHTGDYYGTIGKIYLPSKYRVSTDSGFSMRHELAHALGDPIENVRRFQQTNQYRPVLYDYGDVSPEINLEEYYADYLGSLGGRISIDNAIKNSKDQNFIDRMLSNSYLFKDGTELNFNDWLSLRPSKTYDQNDARSLRSHAKEYFQIERDAKRNSTWLKNKDGSTWQGDPRSWVQMQSKSFQNYVKDSPFKDRIFAHSSNDAFDTFDLKYFGKTDDGEHGRGFYSHPAEFIDGKLQGVNNYGKYIYLLVTNVKNPLTPLNIKDFMQATEFNRGNNLLQKYDAVYYGIPGQNYIGASPAELVVPKPSNYKSIVGNNGDFSPNNSNMFR